MALNPWRRVPRDEETGAAAARRAFAAAAPARPVDSDDDDEGEDEDDEDVAAAGGGLSDTESQYEELMGAEEVTEEDEQAMALFMGSDAAAGSVQQRTLADVIAARIRERTAAVGPGASKPEEEAGARTVPGLDPKIAEVYRGVGKLLSRHRAGKVPKAFKIIPSLTNWQEVLHLTEPEAWSPAAVLAATRLFASNLSARLAQRFYALVLLPRVRSDIREHKRLHFALYQALKKAVYKPAAFYKGIFLPLCQSGTCSLREAVIVGSILQKVSIPVLHSSVALMKVAEMPYAGTNSYFVKLLLDKKYALPYRVLDAVTLHFTRFNDDDRDLPVIWHQSLLTFVQRYKNEMTEGDRESLRRLVRKHKHYLMTPEILRELQHSIPLRGHQGPSPVFNFDILPSKQDAITDAMASSFLKGVAYVWHL
eukprot:SM000027S09628  [mRNA]  locus=s27:462353:465703:+ [translate_table: standard]